MRDRKEYMRKYWHDYYLKNKNEILAKQKEYQHKNKEYISKRHKKYNQKIKASNNILTELEEWCKSWKENEKYCYLASNDKDKCRYDVYGEVLDKIQDLKEKYK